MSRGVESADVTSRVLACDGIHNFRDYGGYAVRGGGRLREGRLYRSAQHLDASADDMAKVAGINLAVVIDLRGANERAAAPCPRPQGFAARVVATDSETAGIAPHLEVARDVRTADEAFESMRRGYAHMMYRTYLVPLYAAYFAALAEAEGPTLIHCLAGKDRTGLAVALFHRMAGVHPDDIMADYLMTNIAGDIDARIAAGARHVRHSFGPWLSDDAVRVMMSVAPEYLDTAFAEIDARSDGFDGYLETVLGVTPARRAAILDRLVI